MDHNQRLIEIARVGVDAYIEQSIKAGDLTEVIVGVLSERSFQTAAFFQDRKNLQYLHGLNFTAVSKRPEECWGHPSHNIANALAVSKAFRSTPMALDLDFLNTSFDGINTPGMFCLVSSDDDWLAAFKQKHSLSFAQVLSALYMPHIKLGLSNAKFVLSKPLADFLNNFDHHFIGDYQKDIQLRAAPELGQSALNFVRQQLDAACAAHVLQLLMEQMDDYTDNVCMQNIDSELLVESVQAIRVFAPEEKHQIDEVIERSINELVLPEQVVSLFRKMISADIFNSLAVPHLENDASDDTSSVPQFY